MAVRRAEGALELQASEAVVVQAASRILAALIRNGRHTEGNHTALLRFAVRTAYELAQEAEVRLLQKTPICSIVEQSAIISFTA